MSKSPWLWFFMRRFMNRKFYIYRREIINSNFGFLINGENSTFQWESLTKHTHCILFLLIQRSKKTKLETNVQQMITFFAYSNNVSEEQDPFLNRPFHGKMAILKVALDEGDLQTENEQKITIVPGPRYYGKMHSPSQT